MWIRIVLVVVGNAFIVAKIVFEANVATRTGANVAGDSNIVVAANIVTDIVVAGVVVADIVVASVVIADVIVAVIVADVGSTTSDRAGGKGCGGCCHHGR